VGREAPKSRPLGKLVIFVDVGSGFDVGDDSLCEPFFVEGADAARRLGSVKP